MEHVPETQNTCPVETGSTLPRDQLAEAEVAMSAARAAYNEAILGVIVVDRFSQPVSKAEQDKKICSCQEKLVSARDARDRLMGEILSFAPIATNPAS